MKKVLIARPHAFVNDEIKAVIENAGFHPLTVGSSIELREIDLSLVSGAVVSLAVNSPVEDSIEDVIEYLRGNQPHLPIAFAALMSFDMACRLLSSMGLKNSGLLAVSEQTRRSSELSQATTYIVMQKNELLNGDNMDLLKYILSKHFS